MTTSPRVQVVIKFALLLAVLLGYVGYLTIKFDPATGLIAAALTWSFFVLCTPVADAGFLLDFPLRLLFGIRMVVSEIAVWGVAIAINGAALLGAPQFYDTTALTRLMYQIIVTPFPYWAIVVLSGFGTFLSIRFGDELMDVIHHHERDYFHSHHFKHELVLFAFFGMILLGYYELISSVGVAEIIE